MESATEIPVNPPSSDSAVTAQDKPIEVTISDSVDKTPFAPEKPAAPADPDTEEEEEEEEEKQTHRAHLTEVRTLHYTSPVDRTFTIRVGVRNDRGMPRNYYDVQVIKTEIPEPKKQRTP